MSGKSAAILAFAVFGVDTTQSGQFDPPDPRIFARAEDQERARPLTKPCSEADVGHGCSRYDGRSYRDAPCSYSIDADTNGSLPTDQCYKMEAPRRFRGVWIDEFEGQRFIPEGTTPHQWPRGDSEALGRTEQAERARLATIWFDTSRVDIVRKSGQTGKRWFIEFVGRKTKYPGAYGHMGMSGHEIIADRVMSLRECPAKGRCG